MEPERGYTGWKAGLTVVFAVVVFVVLMNVVGRQLQPDRPPRPEKTVITVPPSAPSP